MRPKQSSRTQPATRKASRIESGAYVIRRSVTIYLLVFLILAFYDSLPFLLGTREYATVCDGLCGSIVSATTIARSIGVFVGWIVLALVLTSYRWAASVTLSYFCLLVLLDLPELVVTSRTFGPVWSGSVIPYAWEVLRIGIPAFGAALSYLWMRSRRHNQSPV